MITFISLLILLLCISAVNAKDTNNTDYDIYKTNDISIDESITTQNSDNTKDKTIIDIDKTEDVNIDQCIQNQDEDTYKNNVKSSQELIDKIKNADDEELISIEPGTYKIHNITLTKNIYIQGKGNPQDIILDSEKVSTIFFIKNHYLSIHFSNLTFINGQTSNFGGAICIETGNVYVDNCIFINNTALSKTNAGAISNYGDEEHRSYLFVNNSLFIGNYADHDGGAVTTCYANSDIYNSVFINNSACRDGGAIRVSIFGYGNVQDCIFIYNHANEWGGAYYSWAGNSNIKRCIFLNNTAGTNGGAIMVSGNLNLTESIIVNNTADETGGSFYIQQPMFDAKTVIKVEGNIITNNTAPLGEEIFVKWTDTYHLFPKFNNNNWGDEDPSSPSLIDPNNVSTRIHPSTTSNDDSLLYNLNFGLLSRYYDILNKYYPNFSADFNVKIRHNNNDSKNETTLKSSANTNNSSNSLIKHKYKSIAISKLKTKNNNNDIRKTKKEIINTKDSNEHTINNLKLNSENVNNNFESNSTTSPAPNNKNDKKAVEVFKDTKNLSKSLKLFDIKYIICLSIIFLVLIFGFLKRKDNL